MKLKLLYIAALISGCTNVSPEERKIIWKGSKDSCTGRFIAYPYWLYRNTYTPLSSEERVSYSRGESIESISERGGFGRTGIAQDGGTGE